MSKHLSILQTLAESNVPNELITKIYNICQKKSMNLDPVDNTSNFIGTVNTNITYQEYIDLIHEYFPNLTINTQGTYILFEDEYVLNKLLNAGFGDGTGISTAAAATMNFDRDMFADDTTIESFNSFNKFTKHQSINTSFVRCTNLKSINLSALTGTPYGNMFRGCTSLTRINDLGTIITVSNNMFRDCISLEYVHIPSTVKTLDSNAFYNCASLTFTLSQLDNIERINQDALVGTTIDCGNSKELYLPNLKIIKVNAFKNHNEYNYINLPNLETMSGYGTFSNNKSLIEVKSLGKISEIENDAVNGVGAFKDCTSLLKVTLPTSFVKLPNYLFSGCTNLNTLNLSDISNNLIELGTGVFDNCNSLPRLYYFPNVTIDNGWRRMTNRQSIYEPKLKSTTKGSTSRYGTTQLPSNSHYNGGQAFPNFSTLYFRDIEKFGFATFCYVDVYSVIINNVTPPVIDTVDNPHEVLAIWNTYVFANQGSGNNNVDSIYVPDSAVNTYKASPQYANVIDKIKPLSECPRITVEQAQQGITGLIEEYM